MVLLRFCPVWGLPDVRPQLGSVLSLRRFRRRFHDHAFCRCGGGLPPRRTWIEQPYGEEEITLLEEEVIPAIQQCLARVDELDERLLTEQELVQRCQLDAEREALGVLRLQMA